MSEGSTLELSSKGQRNLFYGSTRESQTETRRPEEEQDDERKPCCCSCCAHRCSSCFMFRYFTAVMICIGLAITFGFRCNVGVADSHFRDYLNVTKVNGTRDTQWTSLVIGWVESCYFLGFLAAHIPAGILANKTSASAVYSIAIFASSVLNLFLPAAYSTHFGLVISVRIVQGLLEGSVVPAANGILRYWSPPLDRSRLSTIAMNGMYVGIAVGLVTSGALADWLGWQAPFYVYGTAGITWFCVWQLCIFEKPSRHPRISRHERDHIESAIGENMDVPEKITELPWSKIFTSMPVYAVIVAAFARKWSSNLLAAELYKYFTDVFKFDISQSGIFSALPHAVMAVIVPLGGQLADELRKRGVSTTVVRKLFNTVGYGMEGAFLLGVAFTRNSLTAVVCLCLADSFAALGVSGFTVNLMDVAPRYVSILWGFVNTLALLSSTLVPVVTVQIVRDHRPASWTIAFIIASVIHFVAVIFFLIFASGEEQDWAKKRPEVSAPPESDKTPIVNDDEDSAALADQRRSRLNEDD